MFELLAYTAIIASIWIVIGVFTVAKLYPSYSHNKQFCSELGAAGSATEKLSPLINNYPLGILFCAFGWYVINLENAPILVVLVGWLSIVHGIGTWVAGYFPMDANPYTESPTVTCQVHSWAGLVMLLSLLIAPILIAISDYLSISFRVFSACFVCVTCYFCFRLTKAFKQRTNAGAYQRLAYGVQLIWLSAFSLVI